MVSASKAIIDQFLQSDHYAVVGATPNEKKFGNIIYREMKAKGFQVYPVNPKYPDINGDRCYSSVSDLPASVTSVIMVTPSRETSKMINQCAPEKIKAIWIQQGAESTDALSAVEEKMIPYVSGHCILMFLEPVKGPHAFHRWFLKLFRRYPH
jgi:predicted CoA-binding protein